MTRAHVVTTRSKRSTVFHSLEEKKKTVGPYLYLAIKKKDKQSGYPIHRFCYQRNGHRVYYPRMEDMPKEVIYPAWATEKDKVAAEQKYERLKLRFLPDKESASKRHTMSRERWPRCYFIRLLSCQDASEIPEVINRNIWMYLLDD